MSARLARHRWIAATVGGALGLCLVVAGCSSSGGGNGDDADAARGADQAVDDRSSTGADQGGCTGDQSNRAAGPLHVDPGTAMSYAGTPPVSGKHWGQWPDLTKALYVAAERPELGQLVHSQEHGWTMVWYDESIASDEKAMQTLRAFAAEVDDADLTKVVVVPWTGADGDAFPGGAHVAFTHWGNEDDGTEWRQFCATPSAAALVAFSARHPSSESREPNGP